MRPSLPPKKFSTPFATSYSEQLTSIEVKLAEIRVMFNTLARVDTRNAAKHQDDKLAIAQTIAQRTIELRNTILVLSLPTKTVNLIQRTTLRAGGRVTEYNFFAKMSGLRCYITPRDEVPRDQFSINDLATDETTKTQSFTETMSDLRGCSSVPRPCSTQEEDEVTKTQPITNDEVTKIQNNTKTMSGLRGYTMPRDEVTRD